MSLLTMCYEESEGVTMLNRTESLWVSLLVFYVIFVLSSPLLLSQSCSTLNGGFEQGLKNWTASGINSGFAQLVREGTVFSSVDDTSTIVFNGRYAANVRSHGPNTTQSIGILTSAPFLVESTTISWFQLSESGNVAITFRAIQGGAVVYETSVAAVARRAPASNWGFQKVTLPEILLGQTISIEFRQHTLQEGLGWYTLFDNITTENARIDFEISGQTSETDRTVLISALSYTSQYQNEDRKIQIRGYIRDASGNNIVNKRVYFRVMDPPDTALYAVRAGRAFINDNVDNEGVDLNGGVLSMRNIDTSGATTGPNFKVVLTVTAKNAGDNYSVLASFEDFDNVSGACVLGETATVTAWKRIYVEHDSMFRKGSYVKGIDSVAKDGNNRVHVADRTQFQEGERVRIIHAPWRLFGSGPLDTLGFYKEEHTVVGIQPEPSAPRKSTAGYLVFQYPLQHSYEQDMSFGDVRYLADAVGVISSPTGEPTEFNASTSLLDYRDAFVAHDIPSQDVPNVPFENNVSEAVKHQLTNKWFEKADRTTPYPLPVASFRNHEHLVGASQPDSRAGKGQLGTTKVENGSNFSWVWTGRIEQLVASANNGSVWHLKDPLTINSEVVFHEMAHQWKVNHDNPAYSGGHCDKNMALQPPLLCIMNKNIGGGAELSDGIVGFHYQLVNNKWEGEYLSIRQAQDPVPQN